MDALLHPETLTVLTVSVGAPDDDGVPTEVVERKEWPDVNVQRSSTTEIRDGNEVTLVKLRASGPLAMWIDDLARVEFRGKTYRVDGEPAHYTAGAFDHTEVDLIRWEGQ